MMCPYTVRSKIHVQKNIPMDNTDYVGTCIEVDLYNYCACERENCGAWYGGRCRYNEQ